MLSKEFKPKVVLLGDSSVGKTSILKRLKFNSFDNLTTSTIGCEFFAKDFLVGEKKVKLLIWDTAGQEVFRCFTSNFLRGAKIVLIVYSVNSKESFLNLENWINETEKMKNLSIVIVGSKSDLKNEISENEIDELKNKLNNNISDKNIYFYKNVSSKEMINIKELFNFIAEICVKNNYGEYKNINGLNLNNKISKNNYRGYCC